jgi:protein-S-isoprenylcysteine O-methyltransferase Ste14
MAWSEAPVPAWLRWVAAAGAVLVCFPLLIYVHRALDKQWSIDLRIREDHALITTGPYRWVRHPMYSVLFSFYLALALVAADWIVITLILAGIALVYRRIGPEEQMLIERFGDQYRAYMRRTGRLWPRLAAGMPQAEPVRRLADGRQHPGPQ